eukprot:c20433_g2_i3.p1 GENE.c20433_g2_i3~~c20433_g2_i3.p1  ORF type:complete len:104 (-),score=8.02 c20433_g2_i3:99-410(-)
MCLMQVPCRLPLLHSLPIHCLQYSTHIWTSPLLPAASKSRAQMELSFVWCEPACNPFVHLLFPSHLFLTVRPISTCHSLVLITSILIRHFVLLVKFPPSLAVL